jgi:hypothetical protein
MNCKGGFTGYKVKRPAGYTGASHVRARSAQRRRSGGEVSTQISCARSHLVSAHRQTATHHGTPLRIFRKRMPAATKSLRANGRVGTKIPPNTVERHSAQHAAWDFGLSPFSLNRESVTRGNWKGQGTRALAGWRRRNGIGRQTVERQIKPAQPPPEIRQTLRRPHTATNPKARDR